MPRLFRPRAGKVKGQTPKVEKTETIGKKSIGRAKKRLQYKNRFGTTTRRVSPNNQAARREALGIVRKLPTLNFNLV